MVDYKNNFKLLFEHLGEQNDSPLLRQTLLHLHNEVYSNLRDYILRNSGTEADTRAIINQGLETLYDKRQQHTLKEGNLYGMLMQVCRYKWLDVLRERKKKNTVGIEEYTLQIEQEQAISIDVIDLDREARHALVRKKLNRLGEPKRSILLDQIYAGFSIKDLAIKYNNSENYTKQLLYRARNELRKKLLACPDFNIKEL